MSQKLRGGGKTTELYQFTWPDKSKARALANAPIEATLRPCREESVNFDTTENLYIEGDNLDVLKLLRETYYGKIKMIYIDPPYNTGHDFVYNDNFTQSSDEYKSNSGQYDDQGNQLQQNSESNGRFHTDWLNMMYPRLKIARDLLSEDGVIFISIDDNEQCNLKKMLDEIFGEKNALIEFIRKTKSMTGDDGNGLNVQHEYLIAYAKYKPKALLKGKKKTFSGYSNPDNDPHGIWCSADPSAKSGGAGTYFPITNPQTGQVDYPPKGRFWAFSQSTLTEYIKSGRVKFKDSITKGQRGFIFKRYANLDSVETVDSLTFVDNIYMNSVATSECKNLFESVIFSYPKPVKFLYELINYTCSKSDYVLDFFPGSATTAHAVMKLNAEDGGHRKFIMVQLPEKCYESSEAYKAGYKNICEIGKERIRRAGKMILDEKKSNSGDLFNDNNSDLDIGFRVLKLDSSNMAEVYYKPDELKQEIIMDVVTNIKFGRTPEDLLFQVMLDLGILLSSKIETINVNGNTVFNVNNGYLLACFDSHVEEETVTEIAKMNPIHFVMRNDAVSSDSMMTNFDQIFERFSPETTRKVL